MDSTELTATVKKWYNWYMNRYRVDLNVTLEISAFNEEDARDYVGDIFNIDDEIKAVTIVKIKQA